MHSPNPVKAAIDEQYIYKALELCGVCNVVLANTKMKLVHTTYLPKKDEKSLVCLDIVSSFVSEAVTCHDGKVLTM